MPLGTEVDLSLRDIVFEVDPATPEKGHTHPIQFLAHVYCGQMAGWMKIDLGPGHIVLDGVPTPAKGAQQPPPIFGPCLLWQRSPISATAELLLQQGWLGKRLTAVSVFISSIGLSRCMMYSENHCPCIYSTATQCVPLTQDTSVSRLGNLRLFL